jgi:L-fuconolactonase
VTPEQAAWLSLVQEDALEPEFPIIDAHHHLWEHPTEPYMLDDLRADTGSGHNVEKTVFVECMSGYRTDGPEELRPVGETAFVLEAARASEQTEGAVIAGIVGRADLGLGDGVEKVLQAHLDEGGGRFRGIRHATAWDTDRSIRRSHTHAPEGLMTTPEFWAGLHTLGAMGLSFDAWLYHPQLGELVDAARATPELVVILDHLGGPVGIGRHADRAAALEDWRRSMVEVASCPNVFLKVGGIGMPVFGILWHKHERPPTSAELADAWGDEIRFCIDQFGPQRCMFESNFPVDKKSCSYAVLWNAFKLITADYSDDDKRWLFHDTAATAYRLDS